MLKTFEVRCSEIPRRGAEGAEHLKNQNDALCASARETFVSPVPARFQTVGTEVGHFYPPATLDYADYADGRIREIERPTFNIEHPTSNEWKENLNHYSSLIDTNENLD